jgi:hypothetical protein
LHWVAQFSLAEKKKRLAARVVRTTVVGRLGRHVGKINTLVEHIPVEASQHSVSNIALARGLALKSKLPARPLRGQYEV